MNNGNNGDFGALFIIQFFYTQNEPPPPPHTHHHHHHPLSPKTNSTPLFGLKHHDSDPVRPVRLVSRSQQPGRPAPTECVRAPKASVANLPRLGRRSHAPASLRRTDRGGRSSGLATPSTSSSFSGVFRLSLTFHA